jgi:hypothetical protein
VPRKTPAQKAAQTAAVAAGVAGGKRTRQIAAAMGLSPRRVRELASADETRQVIAALTNDNLETIAALFEAGLRKIRRAYAARVRHVLRDGSIVVVGPDHYARLAAVARLTAILTAGRPMPKPKEAKEADGEGVVDYETLCKIVEHRLQKIQ